MKKRHFKLNHVISSLMLTSAIALAGPAFAEGHAKSESVDWSGTYIGVHAGVMLGRSTPLEYSGVWDLGEYTKAEAAVLAGIQAGIARQMGNFVYGVEVDFAGTTFDTKQSWSTTYSHETDWNWLATLRGRAGLAFGNGQIYVTGGLAAVDVDYNFVDATGGAVFENGTRTGLAVGGG